MIQLRHVGLAIGLVAAVGMSIVAGGSPPSDRERETAEGGTNPAGEGPSGGVRSAQPDDAVAADGGDPSDVRPDLITRVYNIRTLLRQIPDYPFEGIMVPREAPDLPRIGGEGGGGGGLFPGNEAGGGVDDLRPFRHETADEITSLIRDTVDPDSWRDNGGTMGAIRLIDPPGDLIITHTREHHEQISDLLDQIMQDRGTMVRVRAYWVLLPAAQLETILAQQTQEGGDGDDAGDSGGVLQAVDPKALAALPAEAVRYQAQTVCHESQQVHVVAGPARTMVWDVDAVVGNGAAGVDPAVEFFQGGALLQVSALIDARRNVASVDLYAAVMELGDTPEAEKAIEARISARRQGEAADDEARGAAVTADATGGAERLEAAVQEIRTTVEMPIGQPVVVGGMTFQTKGMEMDGGVLYLILEAESSK